MGRNVAILWHALFSAIAGVLYFFFVLPRWHELMGETSHAWGTAFRITTGALIGLAALPVWFTLVRTRKPELGTPALALSVRSWSIAAHVTAGVLIIGAAVSEIWLNLDTAGQWLFGIYGAAAAIAVLGFFAFYLSFVAELPPPPPKPIKPKKTTERARSRSRGRKGKKADKDKADKDIDEEAEDTEDADEVSEAETTEAEVGEPEETPKETKAAEAEVTVVSPTVESPAAASPTEEIAPWENQEVPELEAATEEVPAPKVTAANKTQGKTQDKTTTPADKKAEAAALRNRRPSGKTTHRMSRKRTRGGVSVDE